MTASPDVPTGFDPTDPMICEGAIPLEEFMELRETSPVWWVSQTKGRVRASTMTATGR